MTLPFNNNNKRKWRCFVCGQEYIEYDKFVNHIINQHEEGRDYVLCPLARCRAPVRDVRAHFRAKHPREKMPKAKQMKAMVWKDLKTGKTKTKFREGCFYSKKNGKEIHYRSGYECEVYKLLEMAHEVIAYDTEQVEIPYSFGGKQRRYYPDLHILFNDGSVEIWEIKPASQTSLPINEAKWNSAKAFCLNRGWKFNVMTEVGIGQLKKKMLRRKT
jgi:hypothetical protein